MTLVEWIFEDSYLVDIDLSSWTELIALYLVAPHAAERSTGGVRTLFIVEFLGAHHWDITFNHLNRERAPESNQHELIVWRIANFAVQAIEGELQFTLWGGSEHPHMMVTCASVNIREIPSDIPDLLFPARLGPPYGFVRPGLDALARDRTS